MHWILFSQIFAKLLTETIRQRSGRSSSEFGSRLPSVFSVFSEVIRMLIFSFTFLYLELRVLYMQYVWNKKKYNYFEGGSLIIVKPIP